MGGDDLARKSGRSVDQVQKMFGLCETENGTGSKLAQRSTARC